MKEDSFMKQTNHLMKVSSVIIRLLFVSIVLIALFGMWESAAAQGLQETSNAFRDGAGFSETQNDPRKIVSVLVNGVLSILGMIMTGYLLWGGYLIMTGGGVEERIARGKRSVWTSVVGAAILLSAFALSRFAIYMSSQAADPSKPTFSEEGGSASFDVDVEADADVPDDPLFDTEFRDSGWGADGTFSGECFGPLCE